MTRGLGLITFRQWQQHKLRFILTILGISLGVAVFFSIRITNSSLVDSLHTTIEKLAGKATLQVVAGESGFPMDFLKIVRETPGVDLAEPLTETVANTTFPTREKLLIIGLDTGSDLKLYTDLFDESSFVSRNPMAFVSRSDSIAVNQGFAERFSLKDGDKLTLEVQDGLKDFTIRGIFTSEGVGSLFDGNVAMMDIYAAQDAFGKGSRIDRIDLANAENASIDEVAARIASQLPSGIKVTRPELRGKTLENAFSSMNFGLTIMSFLALTIGVFIIFNSFSISVNQRWKEIGVLRALGVVRGNIQKMFLAEAAIMGTIGSVIGIGLGLALANFSMRFVGNVTASVYGFTSQPQSLEFNFVYAGQAVAAGISASLIAAWLPARLASNIDPALALHNIETRQPEYVMGWPRLIAGIFLVGGGLFMTRIGYVTIGENIGLLYAFLMQFGMILLVPVFIRTGAWAIRPVMDKLFGSEGLIAVETMVASPRRTTSTVIVLMIGLGFVFSHGAFIESHKSSLIRSMKKSVNADMLVSSSNEVHSRTYHFDEERALKIGSLPEIETANNVRVTSIEHEGDEVAVLAHDMDAYFSISPELLDTGDLDAARESMSNGTGILISNNFAVRQNKRLGDIVTLETPGGPLDLKVAGMVEYYRSENGTIFFDRSLYKQYWGDSDVDYVFLDLKPGVDRGQLKSRIEGLLGSQQRAFIYTHEEYLQWVENIIDQFFALMYVQMAIAFFIAALGLANTMVISVAERKRELGIFRSIGGLRRQVAKMVILEAVAISIIGLFAGTIAGLVNAYFLVNAATLIIGGFALPLIFPLSMILAAMPIVIIVAVISAWFPARNASRSNVVEAIGYE